MELFARRHRFSIQESANVLLQLWKETGGSRSFLLGVRYASLRACEADPRKPVLVPSHDKEVFERLPHAPAEIEEGVGERAAG